MNEPTAAAPGTRSEPPRISRGRKLPFIAASILLSLLLMFAVCEIGIRLLNRANILATGQWRTLPGVPFKIASGFEGMNSQGFRDVERPFKKPPSVFRVLFLGDSFVWGVIDREKNFPALIEARLNAMRPDRKIEIINLGVPSYGPEEALALWANHGIQYEPDAVIHGFFYGNDLTDNNPMAYHRAILGELVIIHRDSLPDRSLFLVYLRTKWRLMLYNLTHRGDSSEDPLFNERELLRLVSGNLQYYDPRTPEANRPLLDHVTEILKRMRTLSSEQGTPLLVMRYPGQFMVDEPASRDAIGKLGLRYEDYDMRLLNRQMDEALRKVGLPSEDITEAINEAMKREQLYIKGDTHWNERGAEVAAEAMLPGIRRFLEGSGLRFDAPPGE